MAIVPLDYPKARLRIIAESEPEQTFRAHACEKEPWTVAFIERAAEEAKGSPNGAAFIDVGACVGSYSLVALACGLRVFAIEPGFRNYARLCENLALNGMLDAPVFVHCGAAGSFDGFDWFYYGDLRAGAASHRLGEKGPEGHHKQRVRVLPLDRLLVRQAPDGTLVAAETPPWYLKIDVDGGELEVLAGAQGILQSEHVRGVCLEMRLDLEAECTRVLAGLGWAMAERHAPRAGVCYGIFRRGPDPSPPPEGEGKQGAPAGGVLMPPYSVAPFGQR